MDNSTAAPDTGVQPAPVSVTTGSAKPAFPARVITLKRPQEIKRHDVVTRLAELSVPSSREMPCYHLVEAREVSQFEPQHIFEHRVIASLAGVPIALAEKVVTGDFMRIKAAIEHTLSLDGETDLPEPESRTFTLDYPVKLGEGESAMVLKEFTLPDPYDVPSKIITQPRRTAIAEGRSISLAVLAGVIEQPYELVRKITWWDFVKFFPTLTEYMSEGND